MSTKATMCNADYDKHEERNEVTIKVCGYMLKKGRICMEPELDDGFCALHCRQKYK